MWFFAWNKNLKNESKQFKKEFQTRWIAMSVLLIMWFFHTMLINRFGEWERCWTIESHRINRKIHPCQVAQQWALLNEWIPITRMTGCESKKRNVDGHCMRLIYLFDFRYNLLDQFKLIYWFAHTMHTYCVTGHRSTDDDILKRMQPDELHTEWIKSVCKNDLK